MLMAGVVMMATACEKELSGEQQEGAVNFDINLKAETRAVNGGDFTPETLKVRIYREDGALIRRYTSTMIMNIFACLRLFFSRLRSTSIPNM